MNMKSAIFLFGIIFHLSHTVHSEGDSSTGTDWTNWDSWFYWEAGKSCTTLCTASNGRSSCDSSAIPPMSQDQMQAMLAAYGEESDYSEDTDSASGCPRYGYDSTAQSWRGVYCSSTVVDCDKVVAGEWMICPCPPMPTAEPTPEPIALPPVETTSNPTASPSVDPTSNPSSVPSADPTSNPTLEPSESPSLNPTTVPSVLPSSTPKRSKVDKNRAGKKEGAQKTKTPILDNPGNGAKTDKKHSKTPKAPLVPKRSKIPKATQTGHTKGSKLGKLLEE